MKTDIFNVFPFSRCSESGKSLLMQSDGVTEKHFSPGDIMSSGEHAICVLLSGNATVTALEGGKSVQINKLASGDIFGVAVLFSSADFPTLVTACTDCTTVFISEENILSLIEADSAFALGYIEFLTRKIRFLNDRIRAFTAPDAQGKLAVYILQNADVLGSLKVKSMSELAKKLDIGRASLYRAVDALIAANAVSRKDGSILIINAEKLRSIAKKEI